MVKLLTLRLCHICPGTNEICRCLDLLALADFAPSHSVRSSPVLQRRSFTGPDFKSYICVSQLRLVVRAQLNRANLRSYCQTRQCWSKKDHDFVNALLSRNTFIPFCCILRVFVTKPPFFFSSWKWLHLCPFGFLLCVVLGLSSCVQRHFTQRPLITPSED